MQLVDVAAAMSIQALRGTDQVFLAEIHACARTPVSWLARRTSCPVGRLGDRQFAPG